MREIVDVMRDVAVEVDVHWILGPDSQGLATWGDVGAYMKVRVQHMDDDVINTITDKLRHEYHIKVLQMEVKEVPRYDIFLQHNRGLLTLWCVGSLKGERSPGLSTKKMAAMRRLPRLPPPSRRRKHRLLKPPNSHPIGSIGPLGIRPIMGQP